ncbi:hypothetical protein BDM02DRAFT_1976057 [Thelephora ganbajun]|uniref:Uncharacterized protein n=1 Tax=Thelephora ganbajun TaxID=370292 RepID=A0ACB6YZF2_THEGA|nr:hypothetical protein BDM02DRAFT_1976057 [Thelephora ganbajun]
MTCGILISSPHLQVRRSWEMAGREKEYSDKLRLTERILSNVMIRLRSAINPTCSVNKFPPEILTHCFLYLTPYFPFTLGPEEPEHDCIRVAHVCKYWRTVAFGFSGLWDRIEVTRPEILDMSLKLSGSRPLEVCLKHVGHRFRQTLESRACHDVLFDLLVPVGSRIHSLIIHKDLIPPRGRSLFVEGSLPELETLSITSGIGWENESDNEPQRRLRALFRGGLPRLRKLFIPEYTPWPHNDFKNLTSLCLYNQSALEEELCELLQMLRGSPNLEELYVRQHESSDWIDDPPLDLGPAFPAHSLRKLRLHNFSTVATVCILSTMLLQPNGVAVHISDTVMAKDTFGQIFPLFPRGYTLGNAEKLEVYHVPNETFGIMFCCTGGSLRIGGCLSWHDGEDRTEAAVSLFRYIYQECAQTLKELWIHDFNDEEDGYIFDDFTCFNLESLVLVGGGDVSDCLCARLDPGNPEIRDLPTPRLQSLTIRRLNEQSQLERLIGLCEGRSKTDHPIQEVSVAHEWRDAPEWMTRLCRSSPTPIHIDTRDEWDGQMMELPTICRDDGPPWWPSWEEVIDFTSQYGS